MPTATNFGCTLGCWECAARRRRLVLFISHGSRARGSRTPHHAPPRSKQKKTMSQKANGDGRFNLLPICQGRAPSDGVGIHVPSVGWGTPPPPLPPSQVFCTPSAGWSSVAPGGRPYLSPMACGQTPASSVLPAVPGSQHLWHAHTHPPRSSPSARDARALGAQLDATTSSDGTESAQLEEFEQREAAARREKSRSEEASRVAAGFKELSVSPFVCVYRSCARTTAVCACSPRVSAPCGELVQVCM